MLGGCDISRSTRRVAHARRADVRRISLVHCFCSLQARPQFGLWRAIALIQRYRRSPPVHWTVIVIGVNDRTAPVGVRERFSMADEQRSAALIQVSKAEAIDEIVVISTCNRTEFLLWTSDASAASGSVLNFLTHEYGLKLC